MKKIFTLFALAIVASGVNAQEIWDAAVLKDSAAMKNGGEAHDWSVIKADVIVQTENTASNVVIHDPNEVLPWPGKHQATDEEGNLKWTYERDAEGNKIDSTEVWVPNVTDPTTVLSNAEAKIYNFTITASTASVTMIATGTPNLGETNSWQFGLAEDPTAESHGNKTLCAEGCSPQFIDYIKMKSGNCSEMYYDWYEYNEDGDPVHKVANDAWDPACGVKPALGSYYDFTVRKAGELKIGFFIPKNIQSNKLYFAEVQSDGLHYTLLDPSLLTVWGWTNNNTYADDNENTHKNTKPREDYCVIQPTNIQNPFLGYVSFNAEAGKTYMFLSPQTQLGCYGFQFTETSGISTLKTDAAKYGQRFNLAGQRVSNGFKGLVIVDGRKVIMK